MAHEACGRYQRWGRRGKKSHRSGSPCLCGDSGCGFVCPVPERRAGKQFYDVIIADEAQFFQPEQIDQLRDIVDTYNVPVFCYGLRTDFRTKLFPGSARLLEIADSITELKTVCSCGSKAIVNARLDGAGHVITEGEQVMLGGNESYEPMCYKCWKKALEKEKEA